MGATFAYIAVATNYHHLAGQHNIGGSFYSVGQGFTAAVKVVKFRFGHRIVHIESGEKQFFGFEHLVETMNAGGGFFRNTADIFYPFLPVRGIGTEYFFQDSIQFNFIFGFCSFV